MLLMQKKKSVTIQRSQLFGLFCKITAGYYHILKSKFTCPHTAVPSDTQVHFGFKRGGDVNVTCAV